MCKKTMILLGFCMLLVVSGCSSVGTDTENELNKFKKNAVKENNKLSKMDEANLDDNLNAVERKEVDKVFQDDRKEDKRIDDAVF